MFQSEVELKACNKDCSELWLIQSYLNSVKKINVWSWELAAYLYVVYYIVSYHGLLWHIMVFLFYSFCVQRFLNVCL